jgi:ATP-dependent DNA ligase
MADQERCAQVDFPCTLFKLNANSALEQWTIDVKDNVITSVWGQEGGKMQTKTSFVETGKQKRNRQQQAEFEATSTVVKRRRKGYTEDREGARTKQKTHDSPLPMLAQSLYDKNRVPKQEKKITDPTYIQPKLDGIRCIAKLADGALWSRSRKPIKGLDHVTAAIKAVFSKLDSAVFGGELDLNEIWLDGELYTHDIEFQEISSLVRKTKNTTSDSSVMQYHIYDVMIDRPFRKRLEFLGFLGAAVPPGGDNPLRFVQTDHIPKADVKAYHTKALGDGYEGTMLRADNEVGYEQDKRSYSLLKVKDFEQGEYTCTGFKQEKHRDRLGSVMFKDAQENEFSARPAMKEEQREQIWRNQEDYLGKTGTVKYFELTDDGLPRFPSLVGFRHQDDM